MPGDEARREQRVFAKRLDVFSEKGCCVALGFQRKMRPIQYELNQILSLSEN